MGFDWSRAGHAEGAILSCRMIILPSDVISALKSAGALEVFLFTVHVEGAILSCCMIILPSDTYPPKCEVAHVVTCVCHVACR